MVEAAARLTVSEVPLEACEDLGLPPTVTRRIQLLMLTQLVDPCE